MYSLQTKTDCTQCPTTKKSTGEVNGPTLRTATRGQKICRIARKPGSNFARWVVNGEDFRRRLEENDVL